MQDGRVYYDFFHKFNYDIIIKTKKHKCKGGAVPSAPGNSFGPFSARAPPTSLLSTDYASHATRAPKTFFYSNQFIALFVPQLDGFIKSLRITVTTTYNVSHHACGVYLPYDLKLLRIINYVNNIVGSCHKLT